MTEPKPFTNAQKAGFDQLEKSGYLPAVRNWIMSHAAPFFWHDHAGNVLHNGTLCLVNTGTQMLGITAEHVYRQYLKDLASKKIFLCQFGGVIVRPEKLLIDSDRTLDVATFRMSEDLLSPNTRFHRARTWPAPPAEKYKWVFYAGYPKAHRVPKGTTIDNGLQVHFGQIHDVSDTQLMIYLDFGELHWPDHEGEPINEMLGGASGGPVFRVVEEYWPEGGLKRASLEFVGTVCEDSELYKAMFARSAEVIRADGTLIHR
jgi:hypothetical protein